MNLKKLISLMLMLAIVLGCAAAGADAASAKVVDPEAKRNITIHQTGDNPMPADGTSPTTGRNFFDVYNEYFSEESDYAGENANWDGMALTGQYFPVLVLHTGINGAVNVGAPFYGKTADIYYEIAKYSPGVSRLLMLYNDVLPSFAGPSRSLRVQYLFIRQEWNAPLFFQGMQEKDFSKKYTTHCLYMINYFGLPYSWNNTVENSQRMTFNGADGSKAHLAYKYRFEKYADQNNVLWDIASAKREYLGDRSEQLKDYNHTLKFGEMSVEGDDAETVYVYFNKDAAYGAKESSEGTTYINSMYSWDEEKGQYYRYMITDLNNPDNNPIPFTEQRLTNTTSTGPLSAGSATAAGLGLKGNAMITDEEDGAITFSNVIVQHINMHWIQSDAPYPILVGSGNADYFIGGKHYSGVWAREGNDYRSSFDERTVFYGEDGEEISLNPGRTIIVMLDSFSMDEQDNVTRNPLRVLKYE